MIPRSVFILALGLDATQSHSTAQPRLHSLHNHASGITHTSDVLCCRCLEALLVLALLMVSTVAADVDLPVATQGTEQWAGVVAKALTAGGRSQAESLQALKSFQTSVKGKMGKTVS